MNATVDLDLVATFVAVGESANFSTAAKRLGVTTATVSRSIARLEELVGTRLVHRTTRQVSLSTAGQALFERAASHVRAVRAALDNLPERQEEPAGTLRLTAPFDLGVTVLGEVIARYVARYPRVQVDADLSNRTVDLVAEGFDLALRAGSHGRPDSSLTMRKLGTAEMRFYASPAYVARRGAPRSCAAEGHDWVLFGPVMKRLKIPRDHRARVVANDFLFLREAVRSGAGIGMLPAIAAEPLVASGELVAVLPGESLRGGELVMITPATRRPPPKVAAFRDLLIAALKLSSVA